MAVVTAFIPSIQYSFILLQCRLFQTWLLM